MVISHKEDKAPSWAVHCMPDQQEAEEKMHSNLWI